MFWTLLAVVWLALSVSAKAFPGSYAPGLEGRFVLGPEAHTFPGANAPGLRREDASGTATSGPASTSPAFDVETGIKLQLQTSEEAATDVIYTTENGAPYSNPYDALRIGSNGGLHSSP